MDPNAARAELVEMANRYLGLRDRLDDDQLVINDPEKLAELADLGVQMAEKIHDLDVWLRAGGFLPAAWAVEADAQHGRHVDIPKAGS